MHISLLGLIINTLLLLFVGIMTGANLTLYFFRRFINGLDEEGSPSVGQKRSVAYYFWKFVHNICIHPLLAFPWEPKWAQRAHDWTAARCWGGG